MVYGWLGFENSHPNTYPNSPIEMKKSYIYHSLILCSIMNVLLE